jgi:hypothetical protein
MERFLTNDWVTLEQSDAYDYFTELSDKEKRIYHLIDRKLLPKVVFVRLYKKEKNIVFAIKTVSWRFAKNRFFRTSVYDTLATVTPTRIYSSNIKVAGNVLCQFLKIPQTRAINKALFREILKNGKEGYKNYCDKHPFSEFSPDDVKIFTDDPEVFLKRVARNEELHDLFKQAIMLDRRIKTSWSDRKIHDLHLKWTEEIHKIKCRNCSSEPIWKNVPTLPESIELLNSEKRISEEGFTMHHCIYTNYNGGLVSGRRIAFHVKGEDDFTVMFDVLDDKVRFNQAYHAWNKSLSEDEKVFAKSLSDYAESIISINETRKQSTDQDYMLPLF